MDGWQILRVRRLADMNQEDLAYLLGISPCTVLRYERAQSRPDGLVLEILQALQQITKDEPRLRQIRTSVKARIERLAIVWYIIEPAYRGRSRT